MQLHGNKPIFEEVAEYYENLISLGVYPQGSYLPSVREVALESKINPNTVAKAYSLLVEKDLILPIPKKGYQVKKKAEPVNQLKKRILSIRDEGYTLNEIENVIKEIQKEENKDD